VNLEDKKCKMKTPKGDNVKQLNKMEENLHRKLHKRLLCEVNQQISCECMRWWSSAQASLHMSNVFVSIPTWNFTDYTSTFVGKYDVFPEDRIVLGIIRFEDSSFTMFFQNSYLRLSQVSCAR